MKEINRSLKILIVDESIKLVGVRFVSLDEAASGEIGRSEAYKNYSYKTRDRYAVGDFVLVPVSDKDIKLAVVAELDVAPQLFDDDSIQYQWVIGRVDLKPWQLEQQREANALAIIDHALLGS